MFIYVKRFAEKYQVSLELTLLPNDLRRARAYTIGLASEALVDVDHDKMQWNNTQFANDQDLFITGFRYGSQTQIYAMLLRKQKENMLIKDTMLC